MKYVRKVLMIGMLSVSLFATGCGRSFSSDKQNANNVNPNKKDSQTKILDVVEKEIGADLPCLDYVSDDYTVLHDNQYVYVYSLKKNEMISWLDLEEVGYDSTQGDAATMIEVFSDKEHIHVFQANAPKEGFIFNMSNGKCFLYNAKEIKYGDVLNRRIVKNNKYKDSLSEVYRHGAVEFYLKFNQNESRFYKDIYLVRKQGEKMEEYGLFTQKKDGE